MMNKEERLDIKEQLEEIKNCGSKFNDVQYYCLYKYDIERIISYIEDLQQRIDDTLKEINYLHTTCDLSTYQAIKLKQILGGDVDDE